MKNIMGIVEYDGSNYYGWQKQPDKPTVQGEIERVLSILLGEKIHIRGASRTDRGVHAKAQVFNFRYEGKVKLKELLRRLNSILPDTIAIKRLRYADEDFDARRSATGKLYEYRIVTVKSPLTRKFSWYLKAKLDFDLLNELARQITGEHNFYAFSREPGEKIKTVCPIYEAYWRRARGGLIFRIRGGFFLRGMVRSLVGAMVRVATGKLTKDQFLEMLCHGKRIYNYPVAPPEGLTLVKVYYKPESTKGKTNSTG